MVCNVIIAMDAPTSISPSTSKKNLQFQENLINPDDTIQTKKTKLAQFIADENAYGINHALTHGNAKMAIDDTLIVFAEALHKKYLQTKKDNQPNNLSKTGSILKVLREHAPQQELHKSSSHVSHPKKEHTNKERFLHAIRKNNLQKIQDLVSSTAAYDIDEEVVNAAKAKYEQLATPRKKDEELANSSEFQILKLLTNSYVPKHKSHSVRSTAGRRKSKSPEKMQLLTYIDGGNFEEFRTFIQKNTEIIDDEALTLAQQKFENLKSMNSGCKFSSHQFLIMSIIQALMLERKK